MKRALSFLLMIVFMQAQTAPLFAKRGGPDVGGTQNVNTIGTFAGVLIPLSAENPIVRNSNSIGLFSLGVPDVGVARGAFIAFVDGLAYNGTITGVADPLNGQLTGILDATSSITFVDPNDPTGPGLVSIAQGQIEAQIRETANFSQPGAFTFTSFATTRIEGEAVLDIDGGFTVDATDGSTFGNTVRFTVDGFKQSSTVSILDTIGNGTDTTP